MTESDPHRYVITMKPVYRRLIRLASLLLILAGVSAPGLVMWQALAGHLNRLSLVMMIAGFPYLVLCLFASHLLGRLLKLNQLEIDEAGIRWRTTFFRLESSWDNLASAQAGLLGLTTRQPVPLQGMGAFSLLPKQLPGIPSGFFGDLEQGELAQALQHYAPQLNAPVPRQLDV